MTSLRPSRIATAVLIVAAYVLPGTGAQAQSTLPNVVHTIATPDQGVPIERTFDVSVAGTYQVTLTDQGAPSAPLASVKLAITNGSTIVGTPLTAPGTTQFNATAAGSYVVRVIGVPGTVVGSGPFGVAITKVSDGSALFGFSDSLARPPSATPNVSVLDDSFTVSADGTYQVTLTDQLFPQNLNTALLALTQEGGSSLLANLTVTSSTPVATSSASLTGSTPTTKVTYRIFAIGQATTTVNAGLYSVVVRDSTGAAVYSRTLAVGTVTALGAAPLVAGTYTLNYTDLAYPAPLSATGPNGAIIALDDQVAARLTATGSKSFTASKGSYQTFALGTPAGTPGEGSYAVEVLPASGAAALSVAEPVTLSGSAIHAYTFSAPVGTAGSYNVQLADYQTPQTLTSVNLAAVQGAAILGTPLNAGGSFPITAAIGNVSFLVFAQAPSAGSLLGLFVTPAAGGNPILQVNQGVGNLFSALQFTIGTAGNYVADLTDLGFPAHFGNLYLFVTQGPTLVGSVFGGGALPFTATAGTTYFVTFTAQPTTSDNAGTYAINVAPGPTVTLTSDVSSVASGGRANLTWSSQNATACTASGGWTGSQALSGTANTGPLTAAQTFTLSCTGSGQTVKQSVTVTINPPASGGGGGGGTLDLKFLLALMGLLAIRLRSHRFHASSFTEQ